MPHRTLSKFILLPEVYLLKLSTPGRYYGIYFCEKRSRGEVCPKCGNFCDKTYDHRWAQVRDEPIRGRAVILRIKKRRLWCKHCLKPFTEPVRGIWPKRRTTQRYRAALMWACEHFTDLKSVRKSYHCSSDLLYRALYEQLELKRRTRQYPWPKIIGIDEHLFGKDPKYRTPRFASMIVDHVNKRVMEVADGKTGEALRQALQSIPEPENVQYATIDLCDPFKAFIRGQFPNAKIVADKFHVLRLLSPSLLRKRKEITGTRSDLRAKRLLLMSSFKLGYFERRAIHDFLERYPEMHELYRWKERMHGFYRIRGYDRARFALHAMLDDMAHSVLPEIKKLRRTLKKWQEEILNYFATGITNARTEGFNNKAKVVKRRGYGYKNFNNYRLRILNACA